MADIRKNSRKFLSAEASHHITTAKLVPEGTGHRHQEFIASEVPAGIVDRFKVIEVHYHKAKWRLGSGRSVELPIQIFSELKSVRYTGQVVSTGQSLELLRSQLELHMNTAPCDQLLIIKWLRQVVGTSRIETTNLFAHFAPSRQKYDWYRDGGVALTHHTKHLKTIKSRHDQIAQDQINLFPIEELQGLSAIVSSQNAIRYMRLK
jgi:hypothetical protein